MLQLRDMIGSSEVITERSLTPVQGIGCHNKIYGALVPVSVGIPHLVVHDLFFMIILK